MSDYADLLMAELLKIADSNSDLRDDEREHCREAISWISNADSQIAALRQRCGRLASLYKARDKYEEAMSDHARLSGRITQDERIERHLAFIAAKAACEARNDLAPAAGEAQEKTDGT